MKPRGSLGAIVGLVVVALAGVFLLLRSPSGAGPSGAVVPEGGSYVTGIFEDVTARNPWAYYGPQTTIWNAYVTAHIHPSLYRYTVERYDWVPMLADGMPTPLEPDAELWRSTVRVREGFLWSDGTPVMAHDVAFTFHAITTLGANELGGNFPSIAPEDLLVRAEAVDDYTVEFYLTRPDGRYNFGILMAPTFQRAFWEPHLEAALAADDPLGAIFDVEVTNEPVAGSFLYGIWERGSFVNRPANPGFSSRGEREVLYPNGAVRLSTEDLYDWTGYGEPVGDPELEVVTGPYVDDIHYRVFGAQATGVLALQAGEADFLFNPLGLERGFQDQLRDVPGVTLIENPNNGIRYLSFNLRREPMNLLAFRQAVAVLIDREFVTDRVLQGVAYPIYSIVPPANVFWHSPEVQVYGTGMSRAERIREAVGLLESAGFTWDEQPVLDAEGNLTQPGSGLRLPSGEPMEELELLGPGEAYDPLRATFANWIERWLTEVGIPVRPNLTAFNVVTERVFDLQDFDMWILGWSLTVYPSYLEAFFHSRYTELRGLNAQGYENPEYDRLVDEFLREADDMDRAAQLAGQLQAYLARDVPYVVLFDTPLVEAYRSDRVTYPTTSGLGGLQGIRSRETAGFIHAVQLRR